MEGNPEAGILLAGEEHHIHLAVEEHHIRLEVDILRLEVDILRLGEEHHIRLAVAEERHIHLEERRLVVAEEHHIRLVEEEAHHIRLEVDILRLGEEHHNLLVEEQILHLHLVEELPNLLVAGKVLPSRLVVVLACCLCLELKEKTGSNLIFNNSPITMQWHCTGTQSSLVSFQIETVTLRCPGVRQIVL